MPKTIQDTGEIIREQERSLINVADEPGQLNDIAVGQFESSNKRFFESKLFQSILFVYYYNQWKPGASILGGMGDTPSPIFRLGGRISNCPPHFFICSMKFNSALFSVYCGHCLSPSILSNIIQIQTRSHMLTQSCFFSNFLRCY